MGDNDHGGLVGCQIPQNAQNFPGQFGVQSTGWLIEAENVRFQRQRTGNGHPLLLAARKLVGVMPRTVR